MTVKGAGNRKGGGGLEGSRLDHTQSPGWVASGRAAAVQTPDNETNLLVFVINTQFKCEYCNTYDLMIEWV